MLGWLKPLLAASVVFLSPVAASPDHLAFACSGQAEDTSVLSSGKLVEKATRYHIALIILDETNARIRFSQGSNPGRPGDWTNAVFASDTVTSTRRRDLASLKIERVFTFYRNTREYHSVVKSTQPNMAITTIASGACARRDPSNNLF